jgi:hypothetical protein
MILGNKYCGNSKAVYKEALQEIVHRAQLTTEGPCQGLQGEQGFDVQEPALFLRGRLDGLYCGYKGKGYAMEVVTITEKLPQDGFEGQLRRRAEPAG